MIRIAMVEDDAAARAVMRAHLDRFAAETGTTFTVTAFSDAVAFLDGYHPLYDLVLLDVEMPYMLGTDAAKRLRELDPVVLLVFITNMAQYAIHGYAVNAMDYILKPVAYARLRALLCKIVRRLGTGMVIHMEKIIIQTGSAPAAIGPYSQGICTGDFVFVSGQLPINPATGVFGEGIQAQTRQSLLNLKAILEAAGTDLRHVVKTTVFLSDMNNFATMNEVYRELVGTEACPARSAVEVARLPKDALVEIEAIAVR